MEKSGKDEAYNSWGGGYYRAILFVAVGCILFSYLSNIIKTPLATDSANGTGQRYVHKYTGEYDVLIIGASPAIYNIYCQELYEKYGIVSACLGEPQQPAYLSYYTLLDALLGQSPKAVINDTMLPLPASYTKGLF